MMKAGIRVAAILAGVLCVAGMTTTASAQMLQSTDRVFAGVSFGNQAKDRTFTTTGSLPLYDETATFETAASIGSARIIDVNLGARVWGNLGLGASYARYTDSAPGVLTASVPDPLLFDTPHNATISGGELEHEQVQIHISAYWLQPLTDKMDLSLYAGPTIFSVKQDLLTGFTVATGTSNISAVTKSSVDESTIGFHAGADLRFLIVKNIGLGAFARYSAGKVDVASLDSGKMDVGGFQYGGGLRVRF